jgi:hypothetical protein
MIAYVIVNFKTGMISYRVFSLETPMISYHVFSPETQLYDTLPPDMAVSFIITLLQPLNTSPSDIYCSNITYSSMISYVTVDYNIAMISYHIVYCRE